MRKSPLSIRTGTETSNTRLGTRRYWWIASLRPMSRATSSSWLWAISQTLSEAAAAERSTDRLMRRVYHERYGCIEPPVRISICISGPRLIATRSKISPALGVRPCCSVPERITIGPRVSGGPPICDMRWRMLSICARICCRAVCDALTIACFSEAESAASNFCAAAR